MGDLVLGLSASNINEAILDSNRMGLDDLLPPKGHRMSSKTKSELLFEQYLHDHAYTDWEHELSRWVAAGCPPQEGHKPHGK